MDGPSDAAARPRRARRRVAAAAVLGFAGCTGGGEPPAPAVVERDSAGIHIVENPAAMTAAEFAVSAESVLSIGVLDGAPEYQLFGVSAAARLSDGSVVVANAGSREVRFYGPDGVHRVTVGGEGRGPGEFRYPVSILVEPGDTIRVQDFLDRVRFAPDGAFLGRETTDMARLQAVAGPGGLSEGGLWLPDGTLFSPVYVREGVVGPQNAGPPFRPRIMMVRIGGDFTRVDTLGEFGGVEQQYVQVDPGPRGVRAFVPPFAVNSSWAYGAPDGTLVVGDTERPLLHLFRGDGGHVIVRWPGERAPLTADDVEAWKDRQRDASWTRNQLPELERGWARLDVPALKPAYGGPVAMGRDGSTWVPESPDYFANPAPFLVFTPEGRLRGRAVLPGPFRVMDAGPDWVLGVWSDESEVEYLRLYAVGP